MKEPVIEITKKYYVSLWDIHDSVIKALDIKEVSDEALERIFHALPESTKELAYQWGSTDTVFREKIYTDIIDDPHEYRELL